MPPERTSEPEQVMTPTEEALESVPVESAPLAPRRPGLRTLAGAGGWVYRRVRVYIGALSALIVLCVYLTATQSFFLTKANIFNILTGNADLMLVSVGLTFVVLSAGFDLSVGAMSAAAGLAVYEAMHGSLPAGVSVLIAPALGAVVGGGVNGVLIGKFKLNFFVVTLGMTGLILAGVPVPIWICLAVIVIAALVLNHTSFGRAVYAVGGNPEAARLAGINVTLVLILVYAVAGFGAALAGI